MRKRLESSKRTDRRRRSTWREQKEAGAATARVDGDSVVPSISSTSSAPPPRQSARARTAVNKACKCMCKGLRCRRGQHCPCLDPTKAAEQERLAEFCGDCLVDRCRCDGGCVGTGVSAVRCPCADGTPTVVASGQKRCDVCEAANTVAQAASHNAYNKAYNTTYRRETFVCGPKFGENGGCGKTWSKCECFNDLPGMEGWKDDTLSPKDGTLSPDAVSWSFDPQLHGRYDIACDHALAWYFDPQVRGAGQGVMSDAQEKLRLSQKNNFLLDWVTTVCDAHEQQSDAGTDYPHLLTYERFEAILGTMWRPSQGATVDPSRRAEIFPPRLYLPLSKWLYGQGRRDLACCAVLHALAEDLGHPPAN